MSNSFSPTSCMYNPMSPAIPYVAPLSWRAINAAVELRI